MSIKELKKLIYIGESMKKITSVLAMISLAMLLNFCASEETKAPEAAPAPAPAKAAEPAKAPAKK
jgi:PBP1b-binding outer membrane lipoprotein LpoB